MADIVPFASNQNIISFLSVMYHLSCRRNSFYFIMYLYEEIVAVNYL